MLLVLTAGVALAAAIYGTRGPDTLTGTNGSDLIRGDDSRDYVSCGSGFDTVNNMPGPGPSDVFADDCEEVVS